MRIILPGLSGIMLAFNVMATDISEGKQYISLDKVVSLDKKISDEQRVISFFSFNCGHCYQFEKMLHESGNVNKILPDGVEMSRYHVSSMGPLGQELNHAWAVAVMLGVEDKVTMPLFEAVQVSQKVKKVTDIRQIFIDAGIDEIDYDAAWNSFLLKAWLMQQENAAAEYQVQAVPAVFVDGKFKLRPQGMNTQVIDSFVSEYADTIRKLLNK